VTLTERDQARVGIIRLFAETLAGLIFVAVAAIASVLTGMSAYTVGQILALSGSGPEDWRSAGGPSV
jgi:hypothetical protein